MADDGQQPITSERLAEIEARVSGNDDTTQYWNGISGALEQAEEDRAALLADNERLRAREAALLTALPFVRELATAHTNMLDDDDVIIKVSPGRASWVISRAKTLLASTESSERSGD